MASADPGWPPSTGRRKCGGNLPDRQDRPAPAVGTGLAHVDVDGINVVDDHLPGDEILGRFLDGLRGRPISSGHNQPAGDGPSTSLPDMVGSRAGV